MQKIVIPKEYKREAGSSTFTFANLYCEYARFHSDEVNTLIHLIFIPSILFSFLGMAPHFSILNILRIDMSDPSGGASFQLGSFDAFPQTKDVFVFNIWSFIMVVNFVVYFYCDLLIGLVSATWMLTLQAAARHVNTMGQDPESQLYGQTLKFFVIFNLVSWVLQFLGHGVFEKRAPALLTNLFFANIAPFFVSQEILFFSFGYRAKEIKQLSPVIEADIAFYRQQNGISMRPNV